MKKIFGLTFGGLQHKILNLALFVFITAVLCVTGVTFFRAKILSEVVEETRVEQQATITERSTDTLMQSIEVTMTKTNALQAYIADDMFADIQSDVLTLQTLATGLFEDSDHFQDGPCTLPDASKAGQYTPQVLYEDGVDYTQSTLIKTAAYMGDAMTAMCANTEYMYNCYIGLADGTFYMIDPHPENKYDEDGNIITIPVRQRPWYTQAVERGEVSFSGVMPDTYLKTPCVTCSAPVYAHGKLIGVVAIDLFLTSMDEYVQESSGNGGFICIVNDGGQVIFAPADNGLFTVEMYEKSEDLRQSDNKALAAFMTSALTERTGMQEIEVDGKSYYMTGSPMETAGWAVVTVIEKEITEAPAQALIAEYDEINDKSMAGYRASTGELNGITAAVIVLILLSGILFSQVVAKKIVDPIESMTEEITEGARSGKLFEMQPLYKTGDEIEVLAEAFDDLSKKTKQYITDITSITAEKERISTELSLATEIQAAMLPHIFPPYPDRNEFDIYAAMEPAREVGGDFYDFFLIDDDHMCLVMADVSGKGIPAALFMMISKTILQSCAKMGISAAEILTKTNDALCSNNQAEMFVTTWVGILEISTGKLTCANAGHEYPAIKRAGGRFELFKDKHDIVIGWMEGLEYEEYSLQLHAGDRLFLYTDGVPEATNAEKEMFGLERMIDALNATPDAAPRQLLSNVREAVRGFVKDAEQFDDLTMLCIEYRGKAKKDPS